MASTGRVVRVLTGGALVLGILDAAAESALACFGETCTPVTCVTTDHLADGSVTTTTTTSQFLPGHGLSTGPDGSRPPGGVSAFNSYNMTLLAQMPLSTIGGGTAGSSLYGWVDPVTRREYALMGRTNGTAVVDITNPFQPRYVANIPSAGTNTSWREPKVYQNTAYIGVDGGSHRMQIVDLTQVRSYTGTTLTLNYGTFGGTFGGGGATVNNIHTLQINKDSGYLYLSGTSINSGAPLVVNVGNPNAPVAAGMVTNADGYSHESQVLTYRGPDATYFGREIMVSSNGKQGATADTLSVLDLTNKAAITRISSRTYSSAGYAHQGWFTEDHRYFFMNDELDEPNIAPRTRTHLWDMQDLDNPVYRGFYEHQTSSVDHNLYVKDGFLFEANYTTGLRMFKIGNLASTTPSDWLQSVAYFDTYQANDGSSFNGAWNNYPFFPSGTVAVSDINGGLFLIRPDVRGWSWGAIDPYPNPRNLAGAPGGAGAIPEPASAALILAAGGILAARRRR